MSPVPIGDWIASIEPAAMRTTVATALTDVADSTSSVSIALIRASRLLPETDYAVVLSNGEHVAALSAGHPAYFKAMDERNYSVTTLPHGDGWRALPSHTILDLDYCGPTWMPLTQPTALGDA